MLNISVIICTHNPDRDYLELTLKSLKNQSLPTSEWELLVIDNASDYPISQYLDLSWHRAGSIIIEQRLGLSHARLCGIANAKGNLLVFVDDDNILQSNYLETALTISSTHPYLGAFGAGTIELKCEHAPSNELLPHVNNMLGARKILRVEWSNRIDSECSPIGAGLVIHHSVASSWATETKSNKLRTYLDRSGSTLNSHGDTDMVWHACEIGYGKGLFPQLSLTHLIPAKRTTEEYILRLHEGMVFSYYMLSLFYPTLQASVPSPSWRRRLVRLTRFVFASSLSRKMALATARAERNAKKMLSSLQALN